MPENSAFTPRSQLALLRRLRDAVARASELELADLDREIKTAQRAKPAPGPTQVVGRDNQRTLLREMQLAREPLTPREIAQRLKLSPKTVSRWLATAKRHAFVERVDGARYQVAKEVPVL